MEAELITIGDEILIGQTIDTNSAWMAKQLYLLGIKVAQITSIKDERIPILTALKESSERNKLVLITGGLGPTNDDITKMVLCEYFDTLLERKAEVEERILAYFESRGRKILATNLQQADLPKSCTVLPNDLGTASGMWFEKNGVIYVSMPGVPYEMKGLMLKEVLPRLQKQFSLPKLYYKTIMTEGLGESFIADLVKEWEQSLEEENIKIAYLPSPGIVRIRLSAESGNTDQLQEKVNRKAAELKGQIPNYVFGEDDIQMEEAIAKQLLEVNKTVSTAESCTGGNIAKMLTAVPGSSTYFMGSVVSYSNQSKISLLGVEEASLQAHGAVSEPVVKQMANGIRNRLKTDFAIATSGVAGPDGGSDEKPVGTVWIAVASEAGVFAKKFMFENNRQRNIIRASLAGISMLRRLINGQLEPA